jgi:hypothetical protein
MTAAEVEELLTKVREENAQFVQSQQQAQLQAREAAVIDQMNGWFDAQEVTDVETRLAIARFGEKHVLPNQDGYDPRVAIAALEAGKAEYDAWVEAEAKRYLQKKKVVADAQPTPPGGAPTHGGGTDEAPAVYEGPEALQTAKDRVRARLRANGELQ